jgi:2-polyprenyl-3-methyl-5-hydroxy-6-metoxy-1,4-benzoquinol methylase
MKRSYWENMAPAYNEEIFDVLHNDKKALIRKAIEQSAGNSKTVIDIGCAIGKWIPVLSPNFKKVIAIDISQKNLDIAATTYPDYKNVNYQRVDMSDPKAKFTACDLAICINAILTPSLKDRNTFFAALPKCVKKGGHLILTIPSLESKLLTHIIQHKWQIDKKLFTEKWTGREALRKLDNLRQGNLEIDNVPHKHYLREELQLLLEQEGFDVLETTKIEYGWDTEFVKPPSWLKDPKPWDWMVRAKKK